MLTLQIKEKEIENLTPEEEFVRGTVGAKCQINFDEFWQSYNKYIVFKRVGYEPINFMVDTLENEIEIPYTILAESGEFKIGVFGITETETLPTLYSKDIKILYGTDTHGTTPPTYIPSEIDQLRLSKQDKFASVSHPDPNGNVTWLNIDTPELNVYNSKHTSSLAMNDNGVELTNVSGLAKLNVNQNNIKCSKSSGAIPVLGVATPVAAANTSKNITESDLPYQAANKQYVEDTTNNVKSYVNNNFANALKGSASGEEVRLNDVSPIEHELKIKLKSKNLFNAEAEPLYLIGAEKTLNGTALTFTSTEIMARYAYRIPTETGKQYTVSVKSLVSVPASGQSATGSDIFLSSTGHPDTLNYGSITSSSLTKTFTAKSDYLYIKQYICYGTAQVGGKKTIDGLQVEEGASATSYAPYISDFSGVTLKRYGNTTADEPQTYSPTSDGEVSSVTSLYPTTTLMTDTKGVIIEAEYNRDINKAFAELQAAIISLGGNV